VAGLYISVPSVYTTSVLRRTGRVNFTYVVATGIVIIVVRWRFNVAAAKYNFAFVLE
jgi:hypothetical protein